MQEQKKSAMKCLPARLQLQKSFFLFFFFLRLAESPPFTGLSVLLEGASWEGKMVAERTKQFPGCFLHRTLHLPVTGPQMNESAL